MSDETQGLQGAIAALQAKNLQLDEKLRALEQSYTIDKRTVYVVGAALSVLVVAFSGYSLTQMPEKVLEKVQADLVKSTGKSIDDRMKQMDDKMKLIDEKAKAVDAALVQAQGQLAGAKTVAAPAASAPDSLAERIAQLEKRRLLVGAATASQKRLKYSDLGYSIPEGYQLDCDPGAWIAGMRFYTNKESKFAGFAVECKALTVMAR